LIFQILLVFFLKKTKSGSGTAEKLGVSLAPLIWKQLLGREIRWEEVATLEPEVHLQLAMIESALKPNGYCYRCRKQQVNTCV